MVYTVGGIVKSLREIIADYERNHSFEELNSLKIRQDLEAAVNKGAVGGRKQFGADLRASLEKAKAHADYVEGLGGDL